jgi:hypothetical protein
VALPRFSYEESALYERDVTQRRSVGPTGSSARLTRLPQPLLGSLGLCPSTDPDSCPVARRTLPIFILSDPFSNR